MHASRCSVSAPISDLMLLGHPQAWPVHTTSWYPPISQMLVATALITQRATAQWEGNGTTVLSETIHTHKAVQPMTAKATFTSMHIRALGVTGLQCHASRRHMLISEDACNHHMLQWLQDEAESLITACRSQACCWQNKLLPCTHTRSSRCRHRWEAGWGRRRQLQPQ